MKWLGLVLALGACGDNTVPSGVEVSGTRLQAKFLVDDVGDRQFVGWHDRQLDVDCAWSGGDAPRCAPSVPSAEVYEDGDCSRPLATVGSSPCEPVPTRVSAIDHLAHVDACADPESKVWTVGAPTTADPIYTWVNGTCTPGKPDAGTTYYATSNPLGPEAFVGGKVVNVGTGRVLARTIVGDDGSYAAAGAYDTVLQAPCNVDTTLMACVPAYSSTTLAEDSSCDRPLVGALATCAPPRYIGVAHDQLRLWHTGDLFTKDPSQTFTVYDMSVLVVATGWSCTPETVHVVAGHAVYHAGDELTGDAMSPVTEALGEGKRLQPYVLHTGDYHEPDTRSNKLHDRILGADCTPTQIADGTWRCLPELLYGSSLFSDAACTTPILVAFGQDGVPPGPIILNELVDACTYALHLHELGAPLPPMPLYWQSGDGSCREFMAGATPLFSVGPEVGFDAYARLSLAN